MIKLYSKINCGLAPDRLIGKTMAKSSCLKPYDLKAIYIYGI